MRNWYTILFLALGVIDAVILVDSLYKHYLGGNPNGLPMAMGSGLAGVILIAIYVALGRIDHIPQEVVPEE